MPTRVSRADGQPLGIAGLWESWHSPQHGHTHLSFTMLTINADDHPLMRHLHKPEDEKRMVVILPEDRYAAWLTAGPDESRAFFEQYPAELLVAQAQPRVEWGQTAALF